MCLLLMILSHCFRVFWINLRYFLVGPLATVWKLFLARNVWTSLVKPCVYMITVVLPLSARVIIAFCFVIFCFICLRTYNCLLCVMLYDLAFRTL